MSSRIELVWDRINSICAGSPFEYRQALEPFGLELQPAGSEDKAFYVGMELLSVDGMIGYQQVERWEATIDGVQVAYRQLLVDVSSMMSTLAREDPGQQFTFEDDSIEGDIPEPGETDAVVIAELTAVANFERAL
jgi:hypothetical protein